MHRNTIMKNIGTAIYEARKSRGWSQRRLDVESGVSKTTISHVERNRFVGEMYRHTYYSWGERRRVTHEDIRHWYSEHYFTLVMQICIALEISIDRALHGEVAFQAYPE